MRWDGGVFGSSKYCRTTIDSMCDYCHHRLKSKLVQHSTRAQTLEGPEEPVDGSASGQANNQQMATSTCSMQGWA